MNKTVSIALATYNGARFLREQLDSIYAQTPKVFSYYTGKTRDIDTRISEHQEGVGSDYTRRRGPVKCGWSDVFPDDAPTLCPLAGPK